MSFIGRIPLIRKRRKPVVSNNNESNSSKLSDIMSLNNMRDDVNYNDDDVYDSDHSTGTNVFNSDDERNDDNFHKTRREARFKEMLPPEQNFVVGDGVDMVYLNKKIENGIKYKDLSKKEKQLYDSRNILTNDPSLISNVEKIILKPKRPRKPSEQTLSSKNEAHLIGPNLKTKVDTNVRSKENSRFVTIGEASDMIINDNFDFKNDNGKSEEILAIENKKIRKKQKIIYNDEEVIVPKISKNKSRKMRRQLFVDNENRRRNILLLDKSYKEKTITNHIASINDEDSSNLFENPDQFSDKESNLFENLVSNCSDGGKTSDKELVNKDNEELLEIEDTSALGVDGDSESDTDFRVHLDELLLLQQQQLVKKEAEQKYQKNIKDARDFLETLASMRKANMDVPLEFASKIRKANDLLLRVAQEQNSLKSIIKPDGRDIIFPFIQ